MGEESDYKTNKKPNWRSKYKKLKETYVELRDKYAEQKHELTDITSKFNKLDEVIKILDGRVYTLSEIASLLNVCDDFLGVHKALALCILSSKIRRPGQTTLLKDPIYKETYEDVDQKVMALFQQLIRLLAEGKIEVPTLEALISAHNDKLINLPYLPPHKIPELHVRTTKPRIRNLRKLITNPKRQTLSKIIKREYLKYLESAPNEYDREEILSVMNKFKKHRDRAFYVCLCRVNDYSFNIKNRLDNISDGIKLASKQIYWCDKRVKASLKPIWLNSPDNSQKLLLSSEVRKNAESFANEFVSWLDDIKKDTHLTAGQLNIKLNYAAAIEVSKRHLIIAQNK